MNTDGTGAHPLEKTNPSETNSFLAWFPSPEIVYLPPDGHNLRRVNVETQQDASILSKDSEGWLISTAVISPDEEKVAVHGNRKPTFGIWIISVDGRSERLLYSGDYAPLDGRQMENWFTRLPSDPASDRFFKFHSATRNRLSQSLELAAPSGHLEVLSVRMDARSRRRKIRHMDNGEFFDPDTSGVSRLPK